MTIASVNATIRAKLKLCQWFKGEKTFVPVSSKPNQLKNANFSAKEPHLSNETFYILIPNGKRGSSEVPSNVVNEYLH